MPVGVRIAAFRIVQEALNNAHRHGHDLAPVVRAWVQAGGDQTGMGQPDASQPDASQPDAGLADCVVLRVCDTGPGFNWTGEASDGHLGLVGMRERAESLGGSFSVSSCPLNGTCVEARLPLGPQGVPGTEELSTGHD